MTRTNSVCVGYSVIIVILFFSLTVAPASAQARWLSQKTKPFTNGTSVVEVLEELGTQHKFKVVFENEMNKSEAQAFSVHGNLEGVPLETSIRLICNTIQNDTIRNGDIWPWSADKATLTIHDPEVMTTLTHDISRLGPMLGDLVEFRYAVINSTNADWEDPDGPQDLRLGAILDIQGAAMTVRQTNRSQFLVADLLNQSRVAVSGNQSNSSSAAEKLILKALDKQVSLPAGEMPLSEFLEVTLTKHKIPWLLQPDKYLEKPLNLADNVVVEDKKQRLREILEPALTAKDLAIDIQTGVIVISSAEAIRDQLTFRVYNIQKFLGNASAHEIGVRISGMDDVSVQLFETAGTVLIIEANRENHAKIAAALSGK